MHKIRAGIEADFDKTIMNEVKRKLFSEVNDEKCL